MDKIDILLNRGVDKVYPDKKSLEKVLRSGKKIRLYQGFDPTGTRLHIGHAVGFRKLKQFQIKFLENVELVYYIKTKDVNSAVDNVLYKERIIRFIR